MTWTILIATLGQRRELLRRLIDALMPQVDAADGQVKVLAYWDNGEVSLGAKRQALLDAVDSEYVSFVDDDDMIAADFVPAILEAMASKPDYVGFEVGVWKNDRRYRLSDHSLRHGGWGRSGEVYLRDITHINPMRTKIAQTATFAAPRGAAEDRAWVDQIRAGGLLQTEVVIDRVLYDYLWVPADSAWRAPADKVSALDPAGRAWRLPPVSSPHFAWHPASPLPEDQSTADLLIIVPSRTRPHNIKRLLGGWTDTGAWGVADLRIDIDRDDDAYQKYLEIDLPPGARYATGHRWRTSMFKLNRAARRESDSYFALGFFGDDHLPRTAGWAQRWIDTLREMRSGIVYADDGLRGEGLPTQWAMTSDIVRALENRLSVAPVTHLYCDNAVLDLGKAADCIRYLPDVLIEHMHFVNGKAPKDAQYVKVNSGEQFATDKAIYEKWRREQLAADAAAVRALR